MRRDIITKKSEGGDRKMKVAVIGASNIDITARPYGKYIPRDSNPSRVTVTYGGVGRNIAHNLCFLGETVDFITCFGGDEYASLLMNDCRRLGMDISRAAVYPEERSSYYICITDEGGDLASGASDMELAKHIDVPFLTKNADAFETADAVVFDTNPEPDVLLWLCKNCKTPLFADAVSCGKAGKLRYILDNAKSHSIHTLKMNDLEAEVLFGSSIRDENDMADAAESMLRKGVKRVFITLGAGGVFCMDGNSRLLLPCMKTSIESATGAGDSFLSAVIHAYGNGYGLRKTALCGLAAAKITLESKSAVSENMSAENLEKVISNIM